MTAFGRAVAIAVCLAVAGVACAAPNAPAPSGQPTVSSGAQKGGTLVIAFNADPETLDPHISTALLAARVLALIHDTLINRDFDGSFKPGLAEKWEISPPAKPYTSTLTNHLTSHPAND